MLRTNNLLNRLSQQKCFYNRYQIMKKTSFLLVLLIFVSNTYGQKLNGVWISNDDPIRNAIQTQNRSAGGIIIDFDSNYMSTIQSDSHKNMVVNRKGTKIKVNGLKGKLKVLKVDENSIQLLGTKNTLYVFKKIDLSHKIEMNKKELSNFLINQQCDLLQGIKAQFTGEQFFLDKKSKKPHRRNQFINYSTRDNGYWYFKKIKGNAFFVFTTGQNKAENIFQIMSLNVNGLKLLPIQEDNAIKDLNTIKTCL